MLKLHAECLPLSRHTFIFYWLTLQGELINDDDKINDNDNVDVNRLLDGYTSRSLVIVIVIVNVLYYANKSIQRLCRQESEADYHP